MTENNTYETPKWVRTMFDVPMTVGMIANAWAKLEHMIVPLVGKLLRTTDLNVAKIVVFASNPVARRDLISALTAISPLTDKQKGRIGAFLKEYDRLRVIRNDVVHGHWNSLTADDEPLVRLTKSRQELTEKEEEKSVAYLRQTANQLEQLCYEAAEINNALAGLWPSTDTPRTPHPLR